MQKHVMIHLLILIATSVIGLLGLTKIQINEKFADSYFSKNDDRYQRLIRAQEEFSQLDPILVGIERINPEKGSSFESEMSLVEAALYQIKELEKILISIPQVSIDNDTIQITNSIDYKSLPVSDIKKLFAPATNVHLFMIYLKSQDKDELANTLETIERVIRKQAPNWNFHLLGLQVIQNEVYQIIKQTLSYVIPLSSLIMIFLTIYLSGSIIVSVVAIATVLLSVAVSFGLAGYLGYSITGLSMGIPQILLAIGVCNFMHVYSAFSKQKEIDPKKALNRALKENLAPTFLSSLTTAVAFASFTSSNIKSLFEFSVIAAIGSMLIWYFSLTILSLILSRFKNQPLLSEHLKTYPQNWIVFAKKQRITVILIMLSLSLISAWVAKYIQVGSNFHSIFKSENPVQQSIDFFANKFSVINLRSYSLECPSQGCILKTKEIEKIKNITEALKVDKNLKYTSSILDFIPDYQKGFQQEDLEELQILYTLQFGEDSPFQSVLNEVGNKTRVDLYLSTSKLEEVEKIESRFKTLTDAAGLKLLGIDFGGVLNEFEKQILPQLAKSLLITLAIIASALMITLRNVKLMIQALIPNIIALSLLLLIFYVGKIPITTNTMIVWCVALGLASDDTIHLLYRYRHNRARGLANNQALEQALSSCGAAIIRTSVILSIGFACSILGLYLPGIQAGILLMFATILALIGDLFLIPAFVFNKDTHQ